MKNEEKLGRNIYDPPPYEIEGFNLWRKAMGSFVLMDNFDNKVVLKKPSAKSESNLMLEILPNNIVCRSGKYKSAHDLWTQLIEFHEEPSRLEDRLREDQLGDQTELESILPRD